MQNGRLSLSALSSAQSLLTLLSSRKGPKRECPDYVTGGPNSCYFDSHHTQVWEIYCMNVMAHSSHGNYTSEDHCLDVADIVETDPPFNLTYRLTNSSEEQSGRTAVVSWMYPNAADVHMGWVTLVFELQYRRKSEPHNWKVKGILREARLELLDLPVGSYVVRVRCKSHNSRLWSKWSEPLVINIPSNQTIDKMMAVILVTGIGVMAFLMIGFGVIPQGKRGVDPTLLKNGKIDEITRLFKSFHGYSPPQYSVDTWLQVSTEEGQSLKESPLAQLVKKEGEVAPSTECPIFTNVQQMQECPSPYCEAPPQGVEALPPAPPAESSSWAWPTLGPGNTELLTVPNQGYTVVVSPTPAIGPPPSQPWPPNQDFYTCVNRVNMNGAVQLVPCLSTHHRDTPLLQLKDPVKKDVTEGYSELAMSKAKQRAPDVTMPSVTSGITTGAPASEMQNSYTTVDDLSLHREWGMDVAPAKGDGQERV
ncbi:hypothetical protein JZ751_028086, partial [Albula glossodonta]